MDNNELVKIKTVLGSREVSDELIKQYYEDMSSIALQLNKETTEPIKAIIRESVVELINRQGDEGIANASGGSQSYTYEDAIDNLKKRLLPLRKGVKTL